MATITGHNGTIRFSTDGGHSWVRVADDVRFSLHEPEPLPTSEPSFRLPRSGVITFRILTLRDVWYRYQATAPPWPRSN